MATQFDFSNLGSMFGGGMGGVPSGLDALLSEDQRKLLGRNAALSAAGALLQAGGRSTTPISMGQALGSALQAGQQGYQQARAGSLQDLLLNQKLQEAKTAQDLQKQVAGILSKTPTTLSPEMQALAAPGMQVGPTVARAELAASIPQPSANEIKAGQYQQIADIYAARGKSEEAKRYQEMSERLNPRAEVVGQPFLGQDNKFYIQTKTGGVIPAPIAPAAKPSGAPQQVLGAGNRPVLVQYYDDGSYKQISGVSPLIAPEKVDTGAGIQFVNPYAQAPGSIIPKTLAPQVVGNAEDGYFVVGGGGGGGVRPRPAVAPAAPAATGATAPLAGQTPSAAAPSAAAPSAAAPSAAGPVPLIAGTGKSFAREKDLRSDYTNQMKPFTDLSQAFRKVEAAALNPSAAGDISLVYGYMKILDPGSTVMQGEQATASNAGGVSDRVRAMYNKALTGETLADNVRQDFYAQSRNLVESQRELQQDIAARYSAIATQNKLDPNQIVFDPFKRIKTPTEIAAEAAKEKKKKPASYGATYNLLPRN